MSKSTGIGDFLNSLETDLTCPRVKICSHPKSSFTHLETSTNPLIKSYL